MKKITTFLLLIILALMPFLTLSEAHAQDNNFKFPEIRESYLEQFGWERSFSTLQYTSKLQVGISGSENTFNIPLFAELFTFSNTLRYHVYSPSDNGKQITGTIHINDLKDKTKIQILFGDDPFGFNRSYAAFFDRYDDFHYLYFGQGIEITFTFSIEAPHPDYLETYNLSFFTTKQSDYYYLNHDRYPGLINPESEDGGFIMSHYKFLLPDDYLIQYSSDNHNWVNSPLTNALYVNYLTEKYHDPDNGIISGLQLSPEGTVYVRVKSTSITDPNNPDEEIDPNNPNIDWKNVTDLPKTVAKTPGTVKYQVTGLNLVIEVSYMDTKYLLKYKFTEDTDMSIFDKTKESYYMNTDGLTPQIFINKSDRFYLKDMISDNKPKAFVPHVIWNLSDNQMTNVDVYKAYAHLKQNNQGVLMAYYYTDAFIMDKILSTSLTYTARYYEKQMFGWSTKATPWVTHRFEYTSDDVLKYRDMTSQWYDYLTNFGLISMGIRSNTTYSMPRIAEVNLNNIPKEYNITRTELEQYFSSKSDKYVSIKDNEGYKLWAYALQEGKEYDMGWYGTMKHEFYDNPNNHDDPMNFQMVEIVYMTDGKKYTTVGSDIDISVTIDPNDDGLKREEKERTNWPLTIAAAFLALGVVFGLAQNKFKPGKSLNYLLTIGIIAVAIYLVMVFWPQISAALYVFRL